MRSVRIKIAGFLVLSDFHLKTMLEGHYLPRKVSLYINLCSEGQCPYTAIEGFVAAGCGLGRLDLEAVTMATIPHLIGPQQVMVK